MTRSDYKNKFSELLQNAEIELTPDEYEELLDEVGSDIDWEIEKKTYKKFIFAV